MGPNEWCREGGGSARVGGQFRADRAAKVAGYAFRPFMLRIRHAKALPRCKLDPTAEETSGTNPWRKRESHKGGNRNEPNQRRGIQTTPKPESCHRRIPAGSRIQIVNLRSPGNRVHHSPNRWINQNIAGTVSRLKTVLEKIPSAASGTSPPYRSVITLQLIATGIVAMR